MSISFFITAIMTKPDITSLLKGIFKPQINSSNLIVVLGLIGTTVVPYNIFLHSSLVSEKWNSIEKLKVARIESFISILLGGLVSLSIIITFGIQIFVKYIFINSYDNKQIEFPYLLTVLLAIPFNKLL